MISTKQVLLSTAIAGVAKEEHAAPQQEYVVGSEAEEDDEDQTEGQPLDFGLLLALGGDVTADGSQDASVGSQHHSPRRQESEKSAVKVHPGHPILHGILLEAEGVVEAVLEKLIVEERRRVGHYFCYPHNNADQQGCFDPADFSEFQGMSHCQVTIHRYAAEEGDADVDVGVEDETEQLAGHLTVDPVVMVDEIVDPKRQSGYIQEVSHREVHQVDPQLVLLSDLHVRGPQGHAVGGEAKDDDDNIQHRLEELVYVRVNIARG